MISENLVLFSDPSPEIKEKIQGYVFPEGLSPKVMAYMPSDGSDPISVKKYSPEWEEFARTHGSDFLLVDDSQRGEQALAEIAKLDKANILVITGGNTFKLMQHLRDSGLDEAIKKFHKKGGVIVAFSAGAIVLSPSLETATQADNDKVGLIDLRGLGLLNFLVLPHADAKQDQVNQLISEGKNFRAINNNEFVVV